MPAGWGLHGVAERLRERFPWVAEPPSPPSGPDIEISAELQKPYDIPPGKGIVAAFFPPPPVFPLTLPLLEGLRCRSWKKATVTASASWPG